MKYWNCHSLKSLFLVPMALGQWSLVPIGKMPLPNIKEHQGVWEIATNGNAGGIAYLLPEKTRNETHAPVLSWTWNVEKFPAVRDKSPLSKDGDDYAIRVGALVSGDRAMRIPTDLAKIVEPLGIMISYVVFYSATDRESWTNRCAVSPYSERIITCFRSVGAKLSSQTEAPLKDLGNTLSLQPSERSKLGLVGVWIFADSDNSKSSSLSHLGNISVDGRQMR